MRTVELGAFAPLYVHYIVQCRCSATHPKIALWHNGTIFQSAIPETWQECFDNTLYTVKTGYKVTCYKVKSLIRL